MRRRRKSSNPANKLRRLALAGKWEEVKALLEARLRRDPKDAEARAELERLEHGVPLRAMESPLARLRREEMEMREELAAALNLYRDNPGLINEWEPDFLARHRKRTMQIRSVLKKRMNSDLRWETDAYIADLTRQWALHRGKRRTSLLLGLGLPLLVVLGIAILVPLRHHSEKAETVLREALQSREPIRIERALRLADSGANRMVNTGLVELIKQAHACQARTALAKEELKDALTELEAGDVSISTLPLIRRAELERSLNSLPASMTTLRQRWRFLCEQDEQELARQRSELIERFSIPLPPLPFLCGIPEQDASRVQSQLTEMQNLDKEWQAAGEVFHLDKELGTPLQVRLEELRQLLEDINALRRTADLLPTARSYARYREVLEQHAPKVYEPALRMKDICAQLPDESQLRDLMQEHGHKLSPGMMEAARHALLERGPSFTPAFPANGRQVQLMEDLFTYEGLQKVLYEMSARGLPTIITEEPPRVNDECVSFMPSTLSPGYTLNTPRRIIWRNPQGVYMRRIDATPLLKNTGINREDFFRICNLPCILDSLLRLDAGDCPALARAFVFKRLLEVMREHEWPTMLGIAYAPTLRADARAFAQLLQSLRINVEGGCWLIDSAETDRAEEACARWFHERRHHHYAEEIARNFGALVHVHPRYIGFIGANGKPSLHRSLPAGTLIWYMAKDGLTATPLGEEMESPVLYSPVFVVAKD